MNARVQLCMMVLCEFLEIFNLLERLLLLSLGMNRQKLGKRK